MSINSQAQLEALKRYFGHTSFRDGQKELIDALCSGRDVMGVMPTGAGKSVCYQIPALTLPGITLVVSPLISLMKDQVSSLTTAGIPAAFINSSLEFGEYLDIFRGAENGEYKIIYIAPERLTSPEFLRFASEACISLVAVDEAHCVSQWGQDFRPSYLRIADFIECLPVRPPLGAFTATATAVVRDDIERMLRLRNPLRVTTGFDRPNLYFDVVKPLDRKKYLCEQIEKRPGQSGIVYCATRKNVETVCELLTSQGYSAARYHAGLSDAERKKAQEDFDYDRVRIICATNAFGMGIDKSNVSFVIHYNMPKNLESYYQEAGRAGRDGTPADCILMFSPSDVITAEYMIDKTEAETEDDTQRQQLRRRDMERLETMTAYCKTDNCLRSYILSYFGEQHADACGNCGNCRSEYTERDITVEAQKILSGVARVEKLYPYGYGTVIIMEMLHGGRSKRLAELGLDKLTTYAVMNDVEVSLIRRYIDTLIRCGHLTVDSEYHTLHLTQSASDVLFKGEKVIFRERADADVKKSHGKSHSSRTASKKRDAPKPDEDLFETLRTLRTKIAQQDNVPAYIVFTNAALADMAEKKPRTPDEFLEVSGVGEAKAERYGEAFISAINEYLKEKNPL